MDQYQRLYLMADSSMQYTPAFDFAVRFAQAPDVQLHIAIFDHDNAIALEPLINVDKGHHDRRAWIEKRLAWLSQPITGFTQGDPRITYAVQWSAAVQDEILLGIEDQFSDLFIKDALHEGALRRFFVNPLDWHLMRTCPIPVVFVHPLCQKKASRVVAAVDLNGDQTEMRDFNNKIIAGAAAMARRCSAELHLISTFDEPALTADGSGAFSRTDVKQSERQGLKVSELTMLATLHGIPEARRHLIQGQPVQAIAAFLGSCHDDVLVIGAEQYSLSAPLVRGKSAESIVDQVACNIVVIKA